MYVNARGVERTDQVRGSSGDFAAESLELASLLEMSVEVEAGVVPGVDMYWEN